MRVLVIRIAAGAVFLYLMAAYGQFISDALKRGDYWTYALCLAATFAVGIWMDWRAKP